MKTRLSIYYIDLSSVSDDALHNIVISLPQQYFVMHEAHAVSLRNAEGVSLAEISGQYKKITYNPVNHTIYCVKEFENNGQMIRTLDEWDLQSLSFIKKDVNIPFLSPMQLDNDRWMGFSGPWLIIYNHKKGIEESQLSPIVMHMNKPFLGDVNNVSEHIKNVSAVIKWNHKKLRKILKGYQGEFLQEDDVMGLDLPKTMRTIKKIIPIANQKKIIILSESEDGNSQIHLYNLGTPMIESSFTLHHKIAHAAVVSEGHLMVVADSSHVNQEILKKVKDEISRAVPYCIKDPSSIIAEYAGYDVLYPYSFFSEQKPPVLGQNKSDSALSKMAY